MAKERRSLSGKVVAITGGARGIGKATATALVRKGCRVAIGDLDLALAEQTAAELGGGTSRCRSTSPTAPRSRASSMRPKASSARSTSLVNNAGIMPVTPFVEESEDSVRRQVDINLHGVITGTQLAIERMLPRDTGHIVNIASSGRQGRRARDRHLLGDQARRGRPLRGRSRRAARHGIEMSCVMPVPVNTELMEGVVRPARGQAGRARGRRQRDRRRSRAAALRRLRAALAEVSRSPSATCCRAGPARRWRASWGSTSS